MTDPRAAGLTPDPFDLTFLRRLYREANPEFMVAMHKAFPTLADRLERTEADLAAVTKERDAIERNRDNWRMAAEDGHGHLLYAEAERDEQRRRAEQAQRTYDLLAVAYAYADHLSSCQVVHDSDDTCDCGYREVARAIEANDADDPQEETP